MKYHKISQPECNKIKEEVDYYLKRIPFYLNFAPLEEFGNHSLELYLADNKQYYQACYLEYSDTSWEFLGNSYKEMIQQLIYGHLTTYFMPRYENKDYQMQLNDYIVKCNYFIKQKHVPERKLLLTFPTRTNIRNYFLKKILFRNVKNKNSGCLGADGLFDSFERLYELEKRHYEWIDELDIED